MQTTTPSTKTAFGYQNATYLVRRGGVWQYRRRLPASLVERLAKTEVRISTGARERTDALRPAAQINAVLEAEWRKLLAAPGPASDATEQSFEPTASPPVIAPMPTAGYATHVPNACVRSCFPKQASRTP